ncbi:MAG TPA: D-ribose pyranase [Anaerolineae bacterium]|nr:D-ribose pyranase [Anaerolineae bacterium]HIP71721.1 D-ribose pyranase [Anaerolineae bacterium]
MKKGVLLNQPISAVIAGLGHMDKLVIADAGLPIPRKPERIDLALTHGVPGFLETLTVVLAEMAVETAVIAEEMETVSPDLYAALRDILGDIPIETETHLIFKEMTRSAKAIIRTGEFTPYANVILKAGVVFS